MAAPPERLRVRVMGGLTVDGLTDADLGSRKARLVLKVLVLARGAPVSPAVLTEIVWPDDQPSRPSDQLGVLASRLRRAVGSARLTRSEAGFALHADSLDVDELRALTDGAGTALAEGRVAAARATAAAALELVRGGLLPTDDGEWLEAERAAVAATLTRLHGIAARAALLAGAHVAAELAAEEVLARDPYDEIALRTLMLAQVATGRSASALASYARVRARLQDDLGASPSSETEALHTSILTDARPAAEQPTLRLPPTGRDRELGTLRAHWAVSTGGARAVVVTGEAGIGKSALVRHFANEVAATGGRILLTRADELGRDLPLQPLLGAVGSTGDAAIGVSDTDRSPGAATTVSDAHADQLRRFETLLGALIPDGAPTLLVVEDVHWADGATRDWITWVGRKPAPLLVVVTCRPGFEVAGAEVIDLGPLDGDAVAALIAVDDPADAADIHRRSGGNPLFALALAANRDAELPPTVQDAIVSTLRLLDERDRELACVAAVLDAADDADLLGCVTGLAVIDVIDHLERLARVGIIDESGSGFTFHNTLVRAALAETVSTTRATHLHRTAARALAARAPADPLAVAVHARLGGDVALAARAFHGAALVSLDRADLTTAEVHLRASIDAADSAGARRSLAKVLMLAQRLDAAADEAARAISLDASPSGFEIAGWIEYYRRSYDRAQRFADEAAALSDPGSPLHASALALGGRVRHGRGDPTGADERLTAALDGPPSTRALAEVWLSLLRSHQGRPADGLDAVEHALLDPDHIGHPFAPLHGRFGRVVTLGQLGRTREAFVAIDDFRAAIERAGAVGSRFVAVELNTRSWLLRALDRLDEADELNRAAIARNGSVDGSGPSSESFAEAYWVAHLDLADGCLRRGDIDAADHLTRVMATLDDWHGTMAWHQRHRLGLVRARCARARGDLATATELATTVRDGATGIGCDRYAALAAAQVSLAAVGPIEPGAVEPTLDTLRRCAALELPWLLHELAERADHEDWRAEADHRRRALTVGVTNG